MKTTRQRAALHLLTLGAATGCSAPMIDLGSAPDGGAVSTGAVICTPASASSSAPSSGGGAVCDAGVTYTNAVPIPMSLYPEYCGAPDGTPLSATSASQVAAAMVGSWKACSGSQSIQFTADGKFAYLNQQPDVNGMTAFEMAPSTDPSQSGTFSVVDASATLGAGAYQVRLTYANGGLTTEQVTAFVSPTKLRLFDNTTAQGAADSPWVLVPAMTTAYRNGICGGPAGPAASFASVSDLQNALVGRWAWCSSANDITSGAIGLELDADGTWYALTEDETGQVVRGTTPTDFGAYSLGADGLDLMPSGSLDAGADAGGPMTVEPLGMPSISTCPRTLLIYAGTVNGVPQPQVFWPLP